MDDTSEKRPPSGAQDSQCPQSLLQAWRNRVNNPRNPRAAVLWALAAAAILFALVVLLGQRGQP